MDKPAVTHSVSSPLTERAILALRPGQKKTDGASKPKAGRLIVRAKERRNGGKPITIREFFYRYWDADGAERSMLIGTHGKTSLEEARQEARRLRDLVVRGIDPRFDRDQQAVAQQAAEQRARHEAVRESLKGTLADLLDAYADHLTAQGKASAADVRAALKRHVTGAFPALAARKARDITADDVSDILAMMISKGIERRTNIVRSLLRAAFAFGARQDNDPERKAEALKSGAKVAKRFGIAGNPVADVPRIGRFDRAGDRVLSDDELRAYWIALAPLNADISDSLRVALLLGGQRMSQLLRTTWADYDEQDRTLHLVDTKGRGGSREHVLPISDQVAAILNARARPAQEEAEMLPGGGFIFSTTGGRRPIDVSTLSNAVSIIGKAAFPKKPEAGYSAADLRRTVETRLAALGVSKEHRAEVLSHGRTADVQSRHYERHDDLPTKAATLACWEEHLNAVINGKQTGRIVRGRFRAVTPASA